MTRPRLPKEFVRLCKKVSAKRPRTVITHILKHGFITTQELKDKYGYNHPPRAVRDVKENGIPIEMFRVEGEDRGASASNAGLCQKDHRKESLSRLAQPTLRRSTDKF